MGSRATIVKDKVNGIYHIRIGKEPQIGGDVEPVEVLVQKDGESLEDFKERAARFVQSLPQ